MALLNHLTPREILTRAKRVFHFKRPHVVVSQHPVLTKSLHLLENRLQGAIRFLKNTRVHKHGTLIKLNQLPWYILIGTPGSGKTTLLANSELHFILEKQFPDNNRRNIVPTENCDWWVTHDKVFVDVPGHYITEKKKNALSIRLWQSFLDLLKRYRGKNALSGVLVVLPLDELIQSDTREQLFERLTTRITELNQSFGTELPIYLVVTKSDLLPGFIDFFNDCSSEELVQAWGITLPLNHALDGFNQKFNVLIKRLNEQLIWRLHQEHSPYAKVFIKDFPLQIERLKEALFDFLKLITTHHDEISLKGIYLTSAIQDTYASSQSTNYPTTIPAQELSQSFEILRPPNIKDQAYFIKQFLLHGLAKPFLIQRFALINRYPVTSYLISISLFIFSLGLFGHYFYTQSFSINQNPNPRTELRHTAQQLNFQSKNVSTMHLARSITSNSKETQLEQYV